MSPRSRLLCAILVGLIVLGGAQQPRSLEARASSARGQHQALQDQRHLLQLNQRHLLQYLDNSGGDTASDSERVDSEDFEEEDFEEEDGTEDSDVAGEDGTASRQANTPEPTDDETVKQTDFYLEFGFKAYGEGLMDSKATQWKRIVGRAATVPADKIQIDSFRKRLMARRQGGVVEVSVEATIFQISEQAVKNKQEVVESKEFISKKIKEASKNLFDFDVSRVTDIEAVAYKKGAATALGVTPAPNPVSGGGFKSEYLAALAVLIIPLGFGIYYYTRKKNGSAPSAGGVASTTFSSQPPPVNPSFGQPSAPSLTKQDSGFALPSPPPLPALNHVSSWQPHPPPGPPPGLNSWGSNAPGF